MAREATRKAVWTIPAVISEMVAIDKVDLLKIDVEAAELEVLKGSSHLTHPKIIIEVHSRRTRAMVLGFLHSYSAFHEKVNCTRPLLSVSYFVHDQRQRQ